MREFLWLTILFSLVLSLCSGSVRADSVTAYASLSWTSAQFSGSVAPFPIGGTPGAPSSESFGELAIVPFLSPTDCIDEVQDWTPTACTVQIGPNDYATASAGSQFATIATVSPHYLSLASVTRDGSIVVGTNGDLNISIPFTGTIAATNSGPFTYCGGVEAFLFLYMQVPTVEGTSITDTGCFTNSTSSTGGILTLSETDLAPGTYRFEVQMNSTVEFLPEPSVLSQLGVGLLVLTGIAYRYRKQWLVGPRD